MHSLPMFLSSVPLLFAKRQRKNVAFQTRILYTGLRCQKKLRQICFGILQRVSFDNLIYNENSREFEAFGGLDQIVSYFTDGLYGELGEDAKEDIEEEILDFDDGTEEVFESLLMSDYTKKVELPDQESFGPADLESGDGTFFFGAAVHALSQSIFDEAEEDDIQMEFAACGLLTDYYYRTSDTDAADEPKIKEETARIFSDYEFVKGNPDAASFRNRIAQYKKIMLV